MNELEKLTYSVLAYQESLRTITGNDTLRMSIADGVAVFYWGGTIHAHKELEKLFDVSPAQIVDNVWTCYIVIAPD